jgi:VWFA-related protein
VLPIDRVVPASLRAARLVAAVCLVVAPGLAAQQPPETPVPVLRAGVEQVVVDVVVTDQAGRTVTGLAAGDFTVLENGKAQPVDTFSEITLPYETRPAGSGPPAPAPVRSNAHAADGRVYVLLLDDYFVLVGRTDAVKQVVRDFVERYVQPGDLVAVATTSGLSDATQAFTDDMGRVLRAVERFVGRKARSATVEKIEAAYRAREQDPLRLRRAERGAAQFNRDGAAPEVNAIDADHLDRARVSLRTLKAVAESMAGAPGRRKAIVYVSEGVDVALRAGDDADLSYELNGIIEASARANATVYALNPRGLNTQADEVMEIRALPSGQTIGNGGSGTDMAELQRELRVSANMLQTVADSTGGAAAIETNQLQDTLERVVRDSSHYYLLGYTPAAARRDGKFRTIDVRVNRPGLRVSARRGYQPPDPKEAASEFGGIAPRLAALLKRPLPAAGLPLTAQAVVLPGTADNVSVTVEIGPGALAFAPKGDKWFNAVDVAILPVDAGGRTHTLAQGHPQLTLATDMAETVRGKGLRLSHRLTLAPGDYQLRIAVAEHAVGATGSVLCDVSVPDPATPGLRMTPILASSGEALALPSAYNDPGLLRALGGPPTTARTFDGGDTLSAYVELVDGGASAVRDVDILTVVRDAHGRDIVRSPQPKANAAVAAGQSFAYAIDLPLKAFAAGNYVLRIEARAPGLAEPVARELAFAVRKGT